GFLRFPSRPKGKKRGRLTRVKIRKARRKKPCKIQRFTARRLTTSCERKNSATFWNSRSKRQPSFTKGPPSSLAGPRRATRALPRRASQLRARAYSLASL